MNNLNYKVVKIIADNIFINLDMPFKITDAKTSKGTGAFIDKNGLILTCSHVVADSVSLYIEIPAEGAKKFEVELCGFCPGLDLALLKIKNYKPKHFFKLGDSDKLSPGDEILALGFPGTGDDSDNLKITKGIISGQQYGKIQTDAPINPGNSGGPMIFKNKIVAVNVSGMGGNIQNMNFSVPINSFNKIKKDLLKKTKSLILYRPLLGFEYNTTNELIKNKKVKNGVYVNTVFPNSIFEKINIKEGDIIIKINDHDIDNYGLVNKYWFGEKIDLRIFLNNKKNNETMSIQYWSNKNKKILKKSLKAEPYKMPVRSIYPMFEEIDYEIIGGIILTDFTLNHILLDPDTFTEYFPNYKRLEEKILISEIFQNSYVGRLNVFQKYEFISKVNDKKIKNINSLKKLLKNDKNTFIKLESENKKVVILSKKDILENDKSLVKMLNINLSDYHKNIK